MVQKHWNAFFEAHIRKGLPLYEIKHRLIEHHGYAPAHIDQMIQGYQQQSQQKERPGVLLPIFILLFIIAAFSIAINPNITGMVTATAPKEPSIPLLGIIAVAVVSLTIGLHLRDKRKAASN